MQAIRITTVSAGVVPLIALNGMAIIPPMKPMMVMILNNIRSVGKSGLKKCFINPISLFKTNSNDIYKSNFLHNPPSVKYSNITIMFLLNRHNVKTMKYL